ncbi:aldo/keto reductase [Streptomyces sp. NPDC059568]|uniref:aldo/keto reductase n=1 Tax=Streptomyces sp. NPDC059568 TaxID=3346868 RepID=UPI0036C72833
MNNVPPAGTITIVGKTVSRLGFGTMRLTGPGTWGDPTDRDQAIRLLHQAVHTYGITHIVTADAYGPHTVEHLIRDALHSYRPLDAGSAALGGNVSTPLSWLLQLGPHVAPIPGTSNPQHLADIVKAVATGGLS